MRACTRSYALVCAWLCTCITDTCAWGPFLVYWNVPSQHCAKFGVHINVSQFGLVQNADDAFHGDKVNSSCSSSSSSRDDNDNNNSMFIGVVRYMF